MQRLALRTNFTLDGDIELHDTPVTESVLDIQDLAALLPSSGVNFTQLDAFPDALFPDFLVTSDTVQLWRLFALLEI